MLLKIKDKNSWHIYADVKYIKYENKPRIFRSREELDSFLSNFSGELFLSNKPVVNWNKGYEVKIIHLMTGDKAFSILCDSEVYLCSDMSGDTIESISKRSNRN